MVTLTTPVDLDDLAISLNDAMSHDQLIEFILTLDGYAADYEFTVELRDRLTEALELEDSVIE